MYYDFIGSEESRQLNKLFSKTATEVKDTEISSAYSSVQMLPELIFIRGGDVMKIRQRTKLLTFAVFDDDQIQKHRYSKGMILKTDFNTGS